MNVAFILAGGVGNRFGASIPKQFIEVQGKPILAYTVEAFDQHPEIDAILVVCVKSYMSYMQEMQERFGLRKLKWVAEGGSTFQESVLNGVLFLEDKLSSDDVVLVHSGVSPFITETIISDAIRVCNEKGNAISTTDFFLLSGKKKLKSSVSDPDNYTDEYLDRDDIAVMNTPLTFKFGLLSDVYKEATETGLIDRVESHTTSLMYAMGKRSYFSVGNQLNIKITKPDDLALFENYVIGQQVRANEATAGDVIVFLADGFEECEALLVVDILRRAGLNVITASVSGGRMVNSSRGIMMAADCLAQDADFDQARMAVLPGGRLGVENLRDSEIVRKVCADFAECKTLAAICAAPSILAGWGILNGRKATVHPDFAEKMNGTEVLGEPVVVDGNIVTGQGLGATLQFSLQLVEMLVGEEACERIKEAICYKG